MIFTKTTGAIEEELLEELLLDEELLDEELLEVPVPKRPPLEVFSLLLIALDSQEEEICSDVDSL